VLSKALPFVIISAGYGCSPCPPTITERAESPSKRYLAAVYTSECGPVPPFNESVGLNRADEQKTTSVASIGEAAIELRPKWLSDTELQIVFDCRPEPDLACAASEGRHWSVNKTAQWRDVQIRYAASERLRSRLSRADVDRLLQ
jgi:hypothetical protein